MSRPPRLHIERRACRLSFHSDGPFRFNVSGCAESPRSRSPLALRSFSSPPAAAAAAATPDGDADSERVAGSEGVRRRGLRRLPHDEGGERDRRRRTEPRRDQAERGEGGHAGDERRERHAGVQERADGDGDPPGRGLRRDGRRSGLRGQDQRSSPTTRRSKTAARTRPASSRRSGTSPTRMGRRRRSTSSPRCRARTRPSRAPATRSPTRSARAASCTSRAASARPSRPATATCGAGFYHGLLQWKLAGVSADQVGSVARTACDEPEIKVNAFNYYQCDHGLGHGLMLYTALRPAERARLLPPAPDRVRPGLVQRRRLHGEPELVVRPPHEVAEQEEPALPVQQQAREPPRQALLLPARNVAHPPQRERRLEEDGRLVPEERARLGRHLLPVLRSRRRRQRGPRPAGDEVALCTGRQRGEGLHLRGDPRRHEQQPARSERQGVLRGGQARVPGLLLLRDGNDPRDATERSREQAAACEQWAKDDDLAQCLMGAGA